MNTPLVLKPVTVNMLLTEDLHPLPDDAVMDQHLGMETLETSDQIIKGQHVILAFETTLDFLNWIGSRAFWLFDTEKQQFRNVLIRGQH